ncbi:hypothetical protein KAW18_13870 [candidate division WOR-3 bacterium]|nr:hypothetical protein [candidate division WOR-3 bacterium]
MDKKLNRGEKIQLAETIVLALTFGAIIATFIASFQSIKQQYKFNATLLRPWINCKPEGEVIINENGISLTIKYKNFGESPAFGLKTSAELFYEKFLSNAYVICKDEIKDTIYSIKATIFPREIQTTNPFKQVEGLSTPYTNDTIIQIIENKKLYLIIFTKYHDFSDTEYYYTILLQPEVEKEIKNGCICKWAFLQESQEKCIKVSK